jgi:hypothetical protein
MPDHIGCFGSEGCMDTDKIRFRQKGVHVVHRLHSVALHDRSQDIRVIGNHPHPETLCLERRGSADFAKPDNAQGLVTHFSHADLDSDRRTVA